MLEVTQQPRQLLFTWPGWRLEFDLRQDRWQHALSQSTAEGWRQRLTSIEGAADQIWPESPAFQYAQVERPGASVAEIQLLGQAGRNHYSGAIRCDVERQLIDFDLAVRIQSQPPVPLVVSTYLVANPGNLVPLPDLWQLNVEQLPQQPACELNWTTDSTVCLKIADLQVLQPEKSRATLRWKYHWRLKPIA